MRECASDVLPRIRSVIFGSAHTEREFHVFLQADRFLNLIPKKWVSEEEYEKFWGKSLDSGVKKSMDRWEELLAKAKEAIGVENK